MKSASAILLRVQLEQHKHDLRAHQDILQLDTHTKIKHMVLHFLKYAGRIVEARQSDARDGLTKAIVDTLIICFATANALNKHIAKDSYIQAENLNELCAVLGRTIAPIQNLYEASLNSLVLHSSRMAKATESTDHLEKGDPRSILENEVHDLTMRMLEIAGQANIKAEDEIRSRWSKVEEKSIFHESNFQLNLLNN